MRIFLIGAYPPPYGGVTVHIQRLQDLLLKSGFGCTVMDFSSPTKNTKNVVDARKIRNWLHLVNNSNGIVHIHSSGINIKKTVFFLILSMLSRIRKNSVILTFHSFRDFTVCFPSLKRVLLQTLFKSISHCIVVSPLIKKQLVSSGFDPDQISVTAAFLPPTRHYGAKEVPEEIRAFMNSHQPVISANAFKISFFNSQDLYGIDMCVNLCYKLKSVYPQVGVVFCLSNIGNAGYFNKIKQDITAKHLEDYFLFVINSGPFYPILMKSAVFVRPTNTDADAVSIREALYFKIPTVASDIAPRPRGVILFRNRDMRNFVSTVISVIDEYDFHKKNLSEVKPEDGFRKILHIYKSLGACADQ